MSTKPENPLRVVIAGHVDHGKSTLIGRLLHDTRSLPQGKLEEIEAICAKRGTGALEWSFLLDAFQAERDQAITIDTTQIRFASAMRDYVIIDAPGHREFLKNMICGAAEADAAILVVDAGEGLQEQTRRHAYMLSLLGIEQIGVVVNKMDMEGYSQSVFETIKNEVEAYLASMNLQAGCVIPISARHGDMVAARNQTMLAWYEGPTLLEALDRFSRVDSSDALPLRYAVQDVYRRDSGERILVGRVESGTLSVGDTLLFSPLNEKAKIRSIEVWPEVVPAKTRASSGEVVGITIDQRLFVERGHIASHEQNAPLLSNVFRARLFWLGKTPLTVGSSYRARYATHEAVVSVQSIDRVVNAADLRVCDDQVAALTGGNVAEITLRARDLLPLDPYAANRKTGRIVLYDSHDIAGGGSVCLQGYPDQRRAQHPKSDHICKVDHLLTHEARAARTGHRGGVFWFTGLSGSGKSTTAMTVEKALFDKGYHTYVLDGDNIRHGLNADLGFSPEDRQENIRRIGEVAALMADAGLIVITAFISPYQADREKARMAAPRHFHEIFVKADLATCERRDPKGLYKKARAGEITAFTGIDSPYEEPLNPDMIVDTQHHDIESCVTQLVRYIEAHVRIADPVEQHKKENRTLVA